MFNRLGKTLLALSLAIGAWASPGFDGAASAANNTCVTTSTLKAPRLLPGSRHLKMTYCSDGSVVQVRVGGKGFSVYGRTVDSAKAEFRLKNAKGKIVFRTVYTIMGLEGKIGSLPVLSHWTDASFGEFTLDGVSSGVYKLEGRLLIDWDGDGKGVRRTGYKKILFEK